MKNVILGAIVCLMALALASCDDPAKPAYVWGSMECSNCSNDLNFDGKLNKSGAKYYGYCEEKGGEFKFEVGHEDREHVSGASEGYIFVNGIEGPATVGTFDNLGQPLDDESYWTKFGAANLKNTNTYNIGSESDNDLCRVELFSEAADGELVPANNKKFEYYVRINCQGLDVESTQGQAPISFFRAEFFFDNCK